MQKSSHAIVYIYIVEDIFVVKIDKIYQKFLYFYQLIGYRFP